MASKDDVKQEIITTVDGLVSEEASLAELEQQLQQNEQFKAFIEAQKAFQTKSNLFWKSVEDQMISNGIKSIKGDWGSLTIAERTDFKAIDINVVAPRFLKKTLDTTKIRAEFTLKKKLPTGIESTQKMFLQKRLKTNEG